MLNVSAQSIALYQQFNGRFDFTFVGNTLNGGENNVTPGCNILTTSSAILNLNANDAVEKAFLYWAGSGTGDFTIKLNNIDVVSQRNFLWTQGQINLPFFSAFADITNLVANAGNGMYTVSDLDLNATINTLTYCNNRTNFGGWAMIVVYKNSTLPLNQLNVYDGLQGIPTSVNITLNSLNVIDNAGAKIGFLAWEGDSNLTEGETLKVNGNTLSNALNPPSNAFNSTNSVTNLTTLYNMDLDVYDIQNNIAVGDASATVQMTSGQDFVMINAIVTKLNSQLPDATIAINNVEVKCNSRQIKIDYTVFNTLATNSLPANTKVAIFADNVFVGSVLTNSVLPIGGSESGTTIATIPASISLNFVLKLVVDSDANGVGAVTEILENNNNFAANVRLFENPKFKILENITTCNIGLTKGLFDFSENANLVKLNSGDVVQFFVSKDDAENNLNEIYNTSNYVANTTPRTIFVKLTNADGCQSITSFELLTKNCPPTVFQAVTPNGDGENDTLIVKGLYDIFMKHKLLVYNRWGQLVWQGGNIERFEGLSNKGYRVAGNVLTSGTYFYVLVLNDDSYPEPLNGYLFLRR